MRYLLDLIDNSLDESEAGSATDLSRRRFLVCSTALACGVALGALPEDGIAAPSSDAIYRLERKIERYIGAQRKAGRIRRDERTAWSIYDFRRGKKLVSINEDTPFQSASMIKPFIALAYFYKVEENSRRYRYDRKHRVIMEAMIRRSSNVATNHIMNLIARKPTDVERILKANAPGIFQQTSIVEKIPVNGRTYRNKASAHDYSRFLYGLWYDKFPLSRELKKLMHLPNKDRIYHGAERIPRTTRVYDKTGTTARLCGNMGILEAQGRDGRFYPYTFIGIIQKSTRARPYGSWMRSRGDVIREVSNIVYTDLKRVHNLV